MFLVSFDLTDKKVLVAGGGLEAEKVVTLLLEHEPKITVISPSFTENIRLFHKFGRIKIEERWVENSDVDKDCYFVFALTGDAEINAEISELSKSLRIPVYIEGGKGTDFYLPEMEYNEFTAFSPDGKPVKNYTDRFRNFIEGTE